MEKNTQRLPPAYTYVHASPPVYIKRLIKKVTDKRRVSVLDVVRHVQFYNFVVERARHLRAFSI